MPARQNSQSLGTAGSQTKTPLRLHACECVTGQGSTDRGWYITPDKPAPRWQSWQRGAEGIGNLEMVHRRTALYPSRWRSIGAELTLDSIIDTYVCILFADSAAKTAAKIESPRPVSKKQTKPQLGYSWTQNLCVAAAATATAIVAAHQSDVSP